MATKFSKSPVSFVLPQTNRAQAFWLTLAGFSLCSIMLLGHTVVPQKATGRTAIHKVRMPFATIRW